MRFLFVWSTLVLLGACTPDISQKNINLSDPIDESTLKATDAQEKVETFAIRVNGKQGRIEFISCQQSGAKDWVIALNGDFTEFTNGTCKTPEVQAFLAKGYNVAAANRLGYGKSLPKVKDFSGPATQQAIIDLAKKLKNVSGMWATGSGSIAAAFASKKIPSLQWLILGNSISDLEQFDAKEKTPRYKELLSAAMGDGDAGLFFEQRSIAWDINGITRQVYLYHAKVNPDVPVEQSIALRDRLAAEGYVVKLEELDGVDHDMVGSKQRVVIKVLLEHAMATTKENQP